MKRSQQFALGGWVLFGIAFVFLLAVDTWFPWWVDLIGAAMLAGAVIEESMKYEARRRIIDRL